MANNKTSRNTNSAREENNKYAAPRPLSNNNSIL